MDLTAQLMTFNLNVAIERVGGDEDLFKEVVALYLQEYPELVARIGEAVERGDAELLQQSAHTLKGSLGTLGAEPAAQNALQLEMMGRQKRLDGATEELGVLRHALDRLHTELEQVTR